MKKAIATINTEIGIMTIYYNGANEEMTAETASVVEEIGYKPESEDDAINAVIAMYPADAWDREWIEEV